MNQQLTRKDIYPIFNTQFMEFIDDILTIFPYDESIIKAKNYMGTLIYADATILIEIWIYHVIQKYESHILNGDISFFIEKDYAEETKSLGSSADKVMASINDLRSKIRQMSPSNKNKTIQYMQNLTTISNMYKTCTV
jgi:hypothetical protein